MFIVQRRWLRCFVLTATFAIGCGEHEASDEMPTQAGSGLRGVLRGEADEVLADTTVMACMLTTCLFSETDSRGQFMFAVEGPAEIAFKTHPDMRRTPRRGAALRPVRIVDQSLIDLSTVHVPDLPEGARLGSVSDDPQTLPLGDGLELTLRRADLEPSLGEILVDVAARQISGARVPPLPDLGSEQVIAVYALHPFATKSRSPISVRAPSRLPPGTRVNFRTISEIDGLLSAPASGEADGASVQTDPGAGILALTWLVISN